MATYYRWRKSTAIYADKIDRTVDSIDYGSGINTNIYISSSRPSILVNKYGFDTSSFDLLEIGVGKTEVLSIGTYFFFSHVGGVYTSDYYETKTQTTITALTQGSGTVHGTCDYHYLAPSAGAFISYVYSTDASAYPNGGMQDSYYYDQQTGIDAINITVPSLAMVEQSIPILWNSVIIPDYSGTITYQLQRNVNNSGWETIEQSLSNTSYTDTAQIGWTQVQYQIAIVTEEGISDYTQSSIIPVSNPAALVISGQDGNLSTLTSNIPYTVSSNTGNSISLTRTVNGAQVTTLTVNSGFAYSIPIADLPTGTGTIVITAQVQDTGGKTVIATRTWTYYKTPINIPSTGGIAQLTQNGQNIWPVTVPDAVEAPVYLGGNLNAALNKLGQAALYNKIGKLLCNEVTIDLSKVNVGDEINLPYNNVMAPHIVVHIGNPKPSLYDNSCNGVWLLRKDCIGKGVWNNSKINTLNNSTIMSKMNSFLNQYDLTIQNAIKTVKIPYCVGGGNNTINSGTNGLSCKLFPLSGYEVGCSSDSFDFSKLPQDGVKLSYFILGEGANARNKRVSSSSYWLRSQDIESNSISFGINDYGSEFINTVTQFHGYRPCFIMPKTFTATYYVDTNNNVYPEQQYIKTSSITDVFGYDVPIVQSESGTYVGTGTTGASNPNSIGLPFTPKFVCITNQNDSSKRAFLPYGGYGVCWIQNTATNTAISAYGIATTWTTNGVSWYNSNVVQQMNESGDTYQYTAFA